MAVAVVLDYSSSISDSIYGSPIEKFSQVRESLGSKYSLHSESTMHTMNQTAGSNMQGTSIHIMDETTGSNMRIITTTQDRISSTRYINHGEGCPKLAFIIYFIFY